MIQSKIISVIVPAHNAEKFIGRCIRSLINQSMERNSYEIIAVNDGSVDATSSELMLYKKQITIINQENRGLPAALNTGIRASTGQFIIRVDADDYVHNDYLKIMTVSLLQNNTLDAASCDYIMVDDRQQKVDIVNCEIYPIGCGIIFRREQLISIGMYSEKFLCREEEELRKRFELMHCITRIPIPLYYYHIHGNNMTLNSIKMDKYKKMLNDD